jgi:peptidyl-tRNA hydrolase
MDPAAYVLQDFAQGDLALLSEILDHAAEAVLTYVNEGLDAAMNKFNGEVQP